MRIDSNVFLRAGNYILRRHDVHDYLDRDSRFAWTFNATPWIGGGSPCRRHRGGVGGGDGVVSPGGVFCREFAESRRSASELSMVIARWSAAVGIAGGGVCWGGT